MAGVRTSAVAVLLGGAAGLAAAGLEFGREQGDQVPSCGYGRELESAS